MSHVYYIPRKYTGLPYKDLSCMIDPGKCCCSGIVYTLLYRERERERYIRLPFVVYLQKGCLVIHKSLECRDKEVVANSLILLASLSFTLLPHGLLACQCLWAQVPPWMPRQVVFNRWLDCRVAGLLFDHKCLCISRRSCDIIWLALACCDFGWLFFFALFPFFALLLHFVAFPLILRPPPIALLALLSLAPLPPLALLPLAPLAPPHPPPPCLRYISLSLMSLLW